MSDPVPLSFAVPTVTVPAPLAAYLELTVNGPTVEMRMAPSGRPGPRGRNVNASIASVAASRPTRRPTNARDHVAAQPAPDGVVTSFRMSRSVYATPPTT